MKRSVLAISICASILAFVEKSDALHLPALQTRNAQEAVTSPTPPAKQKRNSKLPPSDSSKQRQNTQILLARVIDVLRVTADGATGWKNAAAAANVQAQVADLIWDSDASTARSYLTRAWDATSRVSDAKQERSLFRNYPARTEARRRVMLVARQRAPELASKWLEQMTEESEAEQDGQSRGVFDDRTARSAMLLQMAMQSVAGNPSAAADMATESLRDGISFGLQSVLIAIQEKDVELAQKVFRVALARLRTIGAADPNELLILYSYLYTPGRISAANTTEDRGFSQVAIGRDRSRITAAAKLNPALALDFLKLSTDLLINSSLPSTTSDPQATARAQVSAITVILNKATENLPQQAAALQERLNLIMADAHFSAAPKTLPSDIPPPRAGESAQDYAGRQVDLLEESAQKETDSLTRDVMYAKAALATTVESYERGRNLAGKIEDETLQSSIANALTYRAALRFIEILDFNKAYEVNARNGDPAQRAACLIVGAQGLVKAKNKIRSRQWLEEARGIIRKAEPDENLTRLALGIVSTYGRFDTLMALDSLPDAVKLMNQSSFPLNDEDKVPLVKRFSGLTLPDFTYGTSGFGLESAIGTFVPDDFESVLATLNKIAEREARGLAVVTLCRKFLLPARELHTKVS